MATAYLSPGVYVEEVDKGARPMEGVGTAMAAFIGIAKWVPEKDGQPVRQPVLVTSWAQFADNFGEFLPGCYLAHAVYGYFLNGGSICYVSAVPVGKKPKPAGEEEKPKAQLKLLAPAGRRTIEAFLVEALEAGEEGKEIAVEVTEPSDSEKGQFNVIVRRGTDEERHENLTLKKDEANYVVNVLKQQSRLVCVTEMQSDLDEAVTSLKVGRWNLEVPQTTAVVPKEIGPKEVEAVINRTDAKVLQGSVAERTGVEGLEVADDVTMVCVPDLMALFEKKVIGEEGLIGAQKAILGHCENMKDRVAILDCPPGLSPQEIKEWRMDKAGFDSKYGALYYPWIRVANPLGNGESIKIPPCGHIAGIYARSDSERGVHKAPANEVVRGALGLETQITKGEQDTLNPQNINCIRAFPGRGIRIWGARTITSDPLWRYINVRRLFNYIEKSIERGTQWIVFEPNDPDLWARIRRDITAFLSNVWRTGALFGPTPAQAFYVKCDDETNPPSVRDLGQVIIEIGLAPVKPAEFVIFRISQWATGAETSE